jgi:hypothetical protein
LAIPAGNTPSARSAVVVMIGPSAVGFSVLVRNEGLVADRRPDIALGVLTGR